MSGMRIWDRIWATADELAQMRDLAAKYGIGVDCAAPPILESSHIDRERHPAIMLAGEGACHVVLVASQHHAPDHGNTESAANLKGNRIGCRSDPRVALWHGSDDRIRRGR